MLHFIMDVSIDTCACSPRLWFLCRVLMICHMGPEVCSIQRRVYKIPSIPIISLYIFLYDIQYCIYHVLFVQCGPCRLIRFFWLAGLELQRPDAAARGAMNGGMDAVSSYCVLKSACVPASIRKLETLHLYIYATSDICAGKMSGRPKIPMALMKRGIAVGECLPARFVH